MSAKIISAFLVFSSLATAASSGRAPEPAQPWPAEVEQALKKANKNRPTLEKALENVPKEQRKGLEFLIANMPDSDLISLREDFLLENLALAYKAKKQVPWGEKISDEVFFNNVLPYANVDEARDPWRKEMYDLCMPIIKDCKTASEAVQLLNAKVFAQLKVRYSTGRKKAQQSPKESIDTGMASCTGLSILLSDACRSVSIPTRVVGTPLWANKRGNHTWLEIWDGKWRFTGACEPDPNGLDRGWFVGDAAQARKDIPEHAIYAASFRKTKTIFPLVWSPDQKDVFAENVTERYARPEPAKENLVRVSIRIWQTGQKKRVALPVAVIDRDDPKKTFEGESRGEQADWNDMLAFNLLPEHEYQVRIGKPAILEKTFKTSKEKSATVEFEVALVDAKQPPPKARLSKEESQLIEKEATTFFTASEEKQATWSFDAKLDALLSRDEAAVKAVIWKVYQALPHEALKKDFEAKQVRFKEHLSPYAVREVGKKPQAGWPLVIAMHGGGGAPKVFNDSQWKQMQRYYKDQLGAGGYTYLALRAPNDTWNGFYDGYVPPLISNLLRQFALFGDIDTNKVYLIGYSHGGYGAFFIGPKIPDRFAAVHCSASAPTDGTISAENLRNTRFTFMIGELDNDFGRRERCEAFDKEIQKLKQENKGDYPVEMEFKKGFGHGGLPDRDKIKELYASTRNPVPNHLTWALTDSVNGDFFWLSVPKPEGGQRFDVQIKDNHIKVSTQKAAKLELNLDSRLVNFEKPIQIEVDGKNQDVVAKPSLLTLCQSILRRGDPELAYTGRIVLELGKK